MTTTAHSDSERNKSDALLRIAIILKYDQNKIRISTDVVNRELEKMTLAEDTDSTYSKLFDTGCGYLSKMYLTRRGSETKLTIDDIEDIVEDSIERAIKKLDTFNYKNNLFTWFLTIVKNRATDIFRSGDYKTKRFSQIASNKEKRFNEELISGESRSPLEKITQEEEIDSVKDKFDYLNDHERETLSLYLERCKPKEIAFISHSKGSTTRSRISYVRNRLKKLLNKGSSKE